MMPWRQPADERAVEFINEAFADLRDENREELVSMLTGKEPVSGRVRRHLAMKMEMALQELDQMRRRTKGGKPRGSMKEESFAKHGVAHLIRLATRALNWKSKKRTPGPVLKELESLAIAIVRDDFPDVVIKPGSVISAPDGRKPLLHQKIPAAVCKFFDDDTDLVRRMLPEKVTLLMQQHRSQSRAR